jgi:heme-degrading monooxygenase HmoA
MVWGGRGPGNGELYPEVSVRRKRSQPRNPEVMRVIVSLVRFRSTLSDEEVQAKFEERSGHYREVAGLVEKLYLRFRETGEFGAVYVWESEDALERFRETDLARTIPEAYGADGTIVAELADVRLIVSEGAGAIG